MTQNSLAKSPKIGMVSFAHMHALSYANALQTLGVGIAGIYDDDAARAEEMAGQLGTQAFSTLDELFAENLNGVIICSENSNHRAHVLAAAGKVPNILCEKTHRHHRKSRSGDDSCVRAGRE